VNGAGKMFGSFQSALDERFVDDYLRVDVRQFASLPDFDLPSHWFEVSLHSINPDGDAVDERKRLRVFGGTGVNAPRTMLAN